MPDLPPTLAEQVRAHLASGRPPCEALCAAPTWQVDGHTVLQSPLEGSGHTGSGLVPLGPRLVLEIASDGVAIRCGQLPDATAVAPPCPGVPPVDAARVGFFVDPAEPLGQLATDAQRARALWLRDDGTSVRFEPGWTVAFGRWHAEPGGIVLDETQRVRGTPGGSTCATVEGRTTVPTATLDRWTRQAPPAFDERSHRRACDAEGEGR